MSSLSLPGHSDARRAAWVDLNGDQRVWLHRIVYLLASTAALLFSRYYVTSTDVTHSLHLLPAQYVSALAFALLHQIASSAADWRSALQIWQTLLRRPRNDVTITAFCLLASHFAGIQAASKLPSIIRIVLYVRYCGCARLYVVSHCVIEQVTLLPTFLYGLEQRTSTQQKTWLPICLIAPFAALVLWSLYMPIHEIVWAVVEAAFGLGMLFGFKALSNNDAPSSEVLISVASVGTIRRLSMRF